jgi:hypothetical protein
LQIYGAGEDDESDDASFGGGAWRPERVEAERGGRRPECKARRVRRQVKEYLRPGGAIAEKKPVSGGDDDEAWASVSPVLAAAHQIETEEGEQVLPPLRLTPAIRRRELLTH